MMTVFIAVDKCTKQNSCLQVSLLTLLLIALMRGVCIRMPFRPNPTACRHLRIIFRHLALLDTLTLTLIPFYHRDAFHVFANRPDEAQAVIVRAGV